MLQKLIELLPERIRVLANRFDASPVTTVEDLAEFVHTRSAFIAQTSLFGYLKTRMGTRFPEFFEDEAFSQTIRIASVKLFVSCLGDLSVFAAAVVSEGGRLSPEESAKLAQRCFASGLDRALVDIDADHVPADALDAFTVRSQDTHWANAVIGTNAFSGSQEDLIRYAPVIDEFKELDREIVTNSIRFRWQDIRDQARKRIDAEAIGEAFRGSGG